MNTYDKFDHNTISWNGKKPGTSVTGEFGGFASLRYSRVAYMKANGAVRYMTMPGDLNSKLHGIALGTIITVTFTGRTGTEMNFTVTVAASNREQIASALGADLSDVLQGYIAENYEYVETLVLNDLLRRGGSHDGVARLLTSGTAVAS